MSGQRLESWKEIAAYLKRGVRTVRRWEEEEGLPVHRQLHKKRGTVYAYGPELDAWREGRREDRTSPRRTPTTGQSLPKRVMIAVLPFASLTDTDDPGHFAEGLTEEMIAHLGQFSPGTLGVIARTTMMVYRRTELSVREIAADLKVDYIVEGSVRREEDQVRVTAQLIQVLDQAQLWSHTYEQTIRSIFVLQRDLATDIAAAIRLTLSPRHLAEPGTATTVTADAYFAHLHGRHLLNSFTPDSVRASVDAFRRAIAADPSYAPAHASLAEAYQQLSVWDPAPPSATFPLALEAAEHALRLNPLLPDAHASLGLISASYLWRWPEADRHFRRALELNPGCSPARQWYAEFLAEMGRFDEALAIIDAALLYDPLSRAIQSTRAFVFLMAGRFDEAIAQAEDVLDADPAYPMALIRLGVAHGAKREWARAIRAFRRAVAATSGLPATVGLLGYAYARAGDAAQAGAALDKLRRMSESRHVPAFPFAMVHLGLDDREKALEYIEQEYEDRSWFMLLLNKGPQFAPLREDPRFQSLIRRMAFSS